MFYAMMIDMELNKLIGRNGTILKTVRNILDRENDLEKLEKLHPYLSECINKIMSLDKIAQETRTESDYEEYINKTQNYYWKEIVHCINSYYCPRNHDSFFDAYAIEYCEQTSEALKKGWEAQSIQKIFEQLFDDKYSSFMDIFTKPLSEFKNVYRASKYNVEEHRSYEYIVPDPKYSKGNRWSEDGEAFLYIAYDNFGKRYKNILTAEKTCFEELRLSGRGKIAICEFSPTNPEAKILDLSYQAGDHVKYEEALERQKQYLSSKIKARVFSDRKLLGRLVRLAESQQNCELYNAVEKAREDIISRDDLWAMVYRIIAPWLLSFICEKVFYAVDQSDDPALEAYIPFRQFSKFVRKNGFEGIAYRSTRMDMKKLRGACITLFNPKLMEPKVGTMKIFQYDNDEYTLLEQY